MPGMRIGESEVKRVGLGTNRLENTNRNRSFLRDVIDAGLDHIDTAHLYRNGDSERTIGEALDGAGEVLIATKGGYNGADRERLRDELEQSLRSLRRDAIDLYYLHRPDPHTPLEESVGLLEGMRREGLIKSIGISNVSIGEIDRAKGEAPIAAVQNEFSLKERKHDETVDFCAVEEIAFVPYFPLRGGGSAVSEIASAHGVSDNQVKLAWLLARSPVITPIPGSLDAGHVQENLAAPDLELTQDELERLAGE